MGKALRYAALTGAIPAALAGVQARAQDIAPPVEIAANVTLDPIVAARLRLETVDQDGAASGADALTLRARVGAELTVSDFSILAEGEGTAAPVDDYNDTLPGNGIEPFPTIADPENLELNRLQVSWMRQGTGATLGRQRIVLDNGRFVGNSGWRQNEQTFDAVRGQAKIGPLSFDATYSISQRTVFGADSPNAHFDGDLVLLNGGIDLPMVDAKAFAYLIDYDTRVASGAARPTWAARSAPTVRSRSTIARCRCSRATCSCSRPTGCTISSARRARWSWSRARLT